MKLYPSAPAEGFVVQTLTVAPLSDKNIDLNGIIQYPRKPFVSKPTDDRKIFSGSRDKLLEILHIYLLEGSELSRIVVPSEGIETGTYTP
ncbi:hypothetical protein PRBEI_2000082900 [Prionailurus iriomotensis]